MSKKKIGVIGLGVLGSTIASYYKEKKYEIFCYDKHKNIGSVEEVNKADIVFICVPTPRGKNNECDVSIVKEAVGYLTGEKIVIIKSTVIPFTTRTLQVDYPQHEFFFNPEFLTARRAWADYYTPVIQILGYTRQSKGTLREIYDIFPPAPFFQAMPAETAEMFKFVRNSYLAAKNSFFNQIYDLCQKTGVKYDLIKQCAEADPWIGPQHLDVQQDNYRGFNGNCLPKDTEALLVWAEENGVDLSVLKTAVDFNSAILASQNLKKDS